MSNKFLIMILVFVHPEGLPEGRVLKRCQFCKPLLIIVLLFRLRRRVYGIDMLTVRI
jgi:hypothetical protein